MSGNTFGNLFRVTTFGESHGVALGVIIDGVPAGIEINIEDIQKELDRRRPGQSKVTTQRNEADKVEMLSGVFEGKSTGTSMAMLIRNNDQISKDYSLLSDIFRPSHADYGFFKKFGIRDYRGGGRSSGRETVGRVAAGAIAKMVLKKYNIEIIGHSKAIGNVSAETFEQAEIEKNMVRCADPLAAEKMVEEIRFAQSQKDSIGGIIECIIKNVPAGLGEVVFDKLDAMLAHAMISIGGIKGIEFGAGFASSKKRGSENNDQRDNEHFFSNNAGGIVGGISNGQEIIFRCAVKPTASIARIQNTININNENCEVEIKGRHDPCLVPRIVPVVESMSAIVLLDAILMQNSREGINMF